MSIEERLAAAMEAADERDSLVGWDCFADETIVDWSALAAAAVEELGLTGQWGLKSGSNPPHPTKSEATARLGATRWPESFTAVHRYTTPWENA